MILRISKIADLVVNNNNKLGEEIGHHSKVIKILGKDEGFDWSNKKILGWESMEFLGKAGEVKFSN